MDEPSRWSVAAISIIIFVIAVLLRVPSCYESLWVDELHSAWCVWDELGDVAGRAEIGHQSPFYFIGLWFWKQVVGSSELALRMSSVLAVAASSSLLVIGIARWSHNLSAGIAAGFVLALEENSLFFGTELRPFAFVILFSSIAAVCFVRLASVNSRHDERGAWIVMIASILLAAICQPTALGALVLLPLTLCSRWLYSDRHRLLQVTLADILLILATAAVGFGLWTMTLDESWGQRSNWSSFATASSIRQAWEVWDWTWLLCVPVGLVAIVWFAGRTPDSAHVMLPTVLVALIAVAVTLAFWGGSRIQWLPLWHRRYFIAVLPMFAVVAGGCVATVADSDRFRRLAPFVCIFLIAGLVYRQNMHLSLMNYPVAYAVRGEDWRGAVMWVRKKAELTDRIYIESGLIESAGWSRRPGALMKGAYPDPFTIYVQPDADQSRYMCFPVDGPYRLDQPTEPVGADLMFPLEVLNNDADQVFILVRRPPDRISIDPTKWGWVYGNRIPETIKSFGNVTVIQLPVLE